jgi:hypothetical protein
VTEIEIERERERERERESERRAEEAECSSSCPAIEAQPLHSNRFGMCLHKFCLKSPVNEFVDSNRGSAALRLLLLSNSQLATLEVSRVAEDQPPLNKS